MELLSQIKEKEGVKQSGKPMADYVELNKKVDRLIVQVDRLEEIVSSLARIEERQMQQKGVVDGFGRRLEGFEQRLRMVELSSALNKSDTNLIGRWVERIIYFIVLAALSAYSWFKAP